MQLNDYGFLYYGLESDENIDYLIYRLKELEIAEQYIGMESTTVEKDGIIIRIWRWIWSKLRAFWNWITGGSKKNKDEKIQEATNKTISNIKANAPTQEKLESKDSELAKKNKELEEQNKKAEEKYNKDLKNQKDLDAKKISEYKAKAEKLKKEINEMEASIKEFNAKADNLKKNTNTFDYDNERAKRQEAIHSKLKEKYTKIITNLNNQLKVLENEYNDAIAKSKNSLNNIDKSKIVNLEKEINIVKSQISAIQIEINKIPKIKDNPINKESELSDKLKALVDEQLKLESVYPIKQTIAKLTEENKKYLDEINRLNHEISSSKVETISYNSKIENTQKRIDTLDSSKRGLARQVLKEKIESKKEELKHIYSILDLSHDSFPIREKDTTVDDSYSKYGFNMPNVSRKGVIASAFKNVNSKTSNLGTHAIMLDPDLKWCASICRGMFNNIIKTLNNLFKNSQFKDDLYNEQMKTMSSGYQELERAVHKLSGNSHKTFTSIDYSGNSEYMINQVNKELDDYADRMKNLLDISSETNYRSLLKKDINKLGFQAEDVQKCKNLIEYLDKLQQLHKQLGGEYARVLINYQIGVQPASSAELKRDYWEVSKTTHLSDLADRVF